MAYRVAGRLAARRGHGGAAFIDVDDRSGRIQVHARKDVLGDESFERLVSLDLGDLIGVDGTAFKTRRGELSLKASGWTLLAKSLRRRRASSTGSRTSRRATAIASST